LDVHRRIIVGAMIAALLAVAACGVPSAQASFETPAVQYYERGRRAVACLRATGKARTLGVSANDGMGTDESVAFNGVVGNRWAWTSVLGSYAESFDSRVDTLTDLRTGKEVTATVEEDGSSGKALALPGALVVAGEKGVTARFTVGGTRVLSRAPASVLAVAGARVYWREDGAARTARLELPAAGASGKRPLARTVARCKPKRGARLLQRWGRFVITRAGGDTWACRGGKTRRLGDVSEFSIVGEREVAYARPGFVGVLDVVNGRRRELPSAGGALAANNLALFTGGPAGISAWRVSQDAPSPVTAEPASELAVGYGETTVVYWLDGAGAPHSADVAP
jgi:hypothetical protein